MDLAILSVLNGLAGRSWLTDWVLVFLAQDLVYALALPLVVLTFGFGLVSPARRSVVAALLAVVLGLLIARQIGHLVASPRPFAQLAWVVKLVPHKADPGMPSSHTTAAFALAAGVVMRYRRLGAVMLLLALLVGLSRVAVGVHWPSQVLAGALLGCALAAGSYLVVGWLAEHLPAFRRPRSSEPATAPSRAP